MATILVVDDEIGIRELLSEILKDEGHSVVLADGVDAAKKHRTTLAPDLVLLDIWMPEMDGVSLLKEWGEQGLLNMPVIMMSGHATVETALEATRMGAVHFLEKPIALQKLLSSVHAALAQKKDKQAPPHLTLTSFQSVPSYQSLMMHLLSVKQRCIVLTGALGAPYELCARTLHRSGTPWLTESSLRHAHADKDLWQAYGGMLFVSDVLALDAASRARLTSLIRHSENHSLRIVLGCPGNEAEKDIRSCLSVISESAECILVAIPRLLDCVEDISLLASAILMYLSKHGYFFAQQFSEEVLALFAQHRWQRDFEELRSMVERLAQGVTVEKITLENVGVVFERPSHQSGAEDGLLMGINLDQPLRVARDAFEVIYLSYHMKSLDGNVSRVAERIGVERTYLYRKLRALGLLRG